VAAVALACCAARAERPAEGIQDNSFLVEEAYNQEPGVVQHIFTAEWDETGQWSWAFTQEWPVFGQTHQLSYTVPYEDDFGDVLLNYRLQALTETESRPAFAPRFSLILPTDTDHVGYQFNLPFSKIVSDQWTAHLNAGMTLLPDAVGGDRENFNFGASAIYAVTPAFNAMLELVTDWDEEADGRRPAAVVISPGVRYALNFPGGEQLVLGVAAPIGLTGSAPDYGVFLYASFEHAFGR
jgi:hypothetical protein